MTLSSKDSGRMVTDVDVKKGTILLLHGHRDNLGGVVGFYNKLSPLYAKSKYDVQHFRVGRIQRATIFNMVAIRFIDLFFSYVHFFLTLTKREPQIIHMNPSLDRKSVYRDVIYLLLSKAWNKNIKVLLHFHGWRDSVQEEFGRKNLFNAVLEFMLRKSESVIVLADRFKKGLTELGADHEKIEVMRTAIDVSKFEDSMSRGDREDVDIRILFLSRLVRDKGIFELARAIRPLIERNGDKALQFIIAGDGEDKSRLERVVVANGVQKHVEFLGYVRDNQKILSFLNSDIFVFPSYHEGCPVAVLEAMAAGLPIVSTNVGALADIIEPNVNGIIVRKRSVEELVEAINTLINDEKLRQRMGLNNRNKAQKELDVNCIFERLEWTYDRMLSQSG